MHTIRLGPPWEVTPVAGATQHSRKFGRPRTLDANERLWIVCAHLPPAARVLVNSQLVGMVSTAGPFAADITELLQPRNTVVLLVESADALGEVALEVRTLG